MSNSTNQKEKLVKLSDQFIGLLKWLIGTIGLGLAGICINQEIQKTELDIKRLEADANFLKVVTEDIKGRTDSTELGYLKFVNTFITTDEIKEEVKLRIKELSKFIDNAEVVKAKEKSTIKQQLVMDELSKEQKRSLIRIKEEDDLPQEEGLQSIDNLIEKESTIIGSTTSIDSTSIISLNATKKMTTPITVSAEKKTYTLIGNPVTKWCKKGYYVEFNNSLRLGINDLDKNSIMFNLKDVEGINKHDPIRIEGNTNVELSEGSVYTLIYENYRYEIELDYIGAAGRNPFTRAAYLTVSTYRSTINKN